jgi:hypothetical protein
MGTKISALPAQTPQLTWNVPLANGTTQTVKATVQQILDLLTAMDAVRIADGSISNTEFQALNGITSNIQTQLNGKQSANSPIIKYKTVDETIASDNVLSDDADLQVPVSAGKKYIIIICMFYNSPSTPDIQYALSVPTGTTGKRTNGSWSGASQAGASSSITSGQGIATTGSESFSMIFYSIDALVNSGTIAFQWAQLASDVGSTILRKGSVMMVWEY